MKAVVITRFGGPEVLQVQERETPEAARGEVRVRVRATAINRADLLQRLGGYAAPADAPADIPGLEFAGEIDQIGPGVAGWSVGDRVFGLCGGGAYAESIALPARTVVKVPERLSFTEAAACPEAFITAWDAAVTQAGLRAGETLLVHAAGSGVGTAAIQLGRVLGARVIGSARSSEKLARARALGLDVGIFVPPDGKFAGPVAAAGAPDVILELVGGAYLTEDLACVALRGRIALVGLMSGARAELDLRQLLTRRAQIFGTVLRSRPLEEKITAVQNFGRHVVPLLERGAVVPVIDRVFPLAAAGEAHAYVASNQGFGKVVLEV
jgi:putative PIG3 family NAD(P)H quinone oxidoreductase